MQPYLYYFCFYFVGWLIVNSFISLPPADDTDSEHTHFPVYYYPLAKEKPNFAILSEGHRSQNREPQSAAQEEHKVTEKIRYVHSKTPFGVQHLVVHCRT